MNNLHFQITTKVLLITVILTVTQMSSTAPPNTATEDLECPTLSNAEALQQSQLIQRLTHVCRYDRLERPIQYGTSGERLPIRVKSRIYIYFMQNVNADLLQFKVHALLQFNFLDSRLAYKHYAPLRKDHILGQKHLSERLWLPHIFLANERESSILGTDEKDVLTSISPEGRVILSTRIQATLYCWMNFKKFPFDSQTCPMVLESWMYNTTELILEWEDNSPISFDPNMRLTEYNMQGFWYNDSVVNSDGINLRHGAFTGNYSSLSFTISLNREIGFYLLDYFLPSMMIVTISWVSFWLQADQSPPRIMLGTSTMLSFITLSSTQTKNLPKVSYIKVSEVWFLGCTFFIFGSLVEFAFVNTIWRRKDNVELEKVNSKNIIKEAFTPKPIRRDLSLNNKSRTRSCSSLDNIISSSESMLKSSNNSSYNNYLTVHNLPMITTECVDSISVTSEKNNQNDHQIIEMEKNINNNLNNNNNDNIDLEHTTFTTMTPQEIAMWIDRRSRFIFPVMFLAFNAFYWTFVYCF